MNEFNLDDATLQALMVHVERIVKPVKASDDRKLGMRTELLAHLRAAFEEELRKSSGDEQLAIEHAQLRLGGSAELTATLQQTVPFHERLLESKVLDLPHYKPLQQKIVDWPVKHRSLTMGHELVLAVTTLLVYVPSVLSLLTIMQSVGMETAHPVAVGIGTFLGWLALLLISSHFVFDAADSSYPTKPTTVLGQAAAILALQTGVTSFLAFTAAQRLATTSEIMTVNLQQLAILGISLLVARWVRELRRPYDQWLSLDLAN